MPWQRDNIMDVMEHEERPGIPFAIGASIAYIIFSMTYITALSCQIASPMEILISIFAGAFVFVAQFGGNTKNKILLASLFSGLLYLVPPGMFRAFCIGLICAYAHTAAEIYSVNISVKAFRQQSVSYTNFLTSMQVCLSFFCLSFFPLEKLLDSFLFVFILVLSQSAAIFFFLPVPPYEIARKDRRNISLIYGTVYRELTKLFKGVPFSSFHAEYSELVEIDGGKKYATSARFWCVLEKLNVSFLSTAILGIISIEPRNTAYLVIFSLSTMFCWFYANSASEEHFEMCVVTLCVLLFLALFLYRMQPIFAVFLACSIYFTPTEEGYLSLDSRAIIFSNTLRYLFAAGVFFILAKERLA